MKVISSGSSKWTHNFVCRGCRAELEADKADLKYRVTDATAAAQQYQLEIEGDFYLVCPECETEKKVKNIPPVIKKEIMNS